PVVKTRSGEWLQDTTIIAEELERRHPEPSIAATTPVQYIVSLLLEAWGDEYWLPIVMHYRWTYKAENKPVIVENSGKALLPGFPKFLQRKLAESGSDRLDKAAPIIGFMPEQHAMIEAWTEATLDLLDLHFSKWDYLLGSQPTVADFSLLASFFGHLNWDPFPKRTLMPSRPALTAFVERMKAGTPASGPLLPDDAIPQTVFPILKRVFDEFFPMVESYRAVAEDHITKNKLASGDPIPRFIEKAQFPMRGETFRRNAMPYTLWLMQRVARLFSEMPEQDQLKVDDWLQANFGRKLSDLDLGPELRRTGLSTVLV
ncbi:MAG: glutathione S-transferase family protein, partial [Pseudomonadota bacterium]